MSLLLVADMGATLGIGLIIGLVIGVVLFGLIMLVAVHSGKKQSAEKSAAAQAAPAPQPAQSAPAQQPAAEKEEEPAGEAEEEQAVAEEEEAEEVEEAEEEPAVAEETEEAEESDEEEDEEEEDDAVPSESTVAALAAEKADDKIRLDKSFQARIIQAGDEIKKSYVDIKTAALSYAGARCYTAWKMERIKSGRKLIAKFVMRGKTLCLYLPLDPSDYFGSGYKVENVGGKAVNAETPLLLRIKNNRRTKQAKELIAVVCENAGIEKADKAPANVGKGLAYRTDAYLMEKGLIKVVEKTAYPEKK